MIASALTIAASLAEVPAGLQVNMPRPDYPIEARRRHLTGTGVLTLHVDSRTGRIVAVEMQKSTGHKILDDAALAAFRTWRFKPGAPHVINVPIKFTMDPRDLYSGRNKSRGQR